MSYNWKSLKKEFITKSNGNKKYTLKQFAEEKGINYKTLRENAKGWVEERRTIQGQKTDKIIEKTIERQIETEVQMNIRHYGMANKLLSTMDKTLDIESIIKSPKSLNTLAKALKTLQEVQRVATDVDKQNGSSVGVIDDFIKAVIDTDGTSNGNEDPNKKV